MDSPFPPRGRDVLNWPHMAFVALGWQRRQGVAEHGEVRRGVAGPGKKEEAGHKTGENSVFAAEIFLGVRNRNERGTSGRLAAPRTPRPAACRAARPPNCRMPYLILARPKGWLGRGTESSRRSLNKAFPLISVEVAATHGLTVDVISGRLVHIAIHPDETRLSF